MSICPCGYWWADLDEDGAPISLEYCHYKGPDAWAPCEYVEYDEYADEAYAEAREAEEEYERWLEEQARLVEDEEPDGYWDWALSGDYDEISDETLEAIRRYKGGLNGRRNSKNYTDLA